METLETPRRTVGLFDIGTNSVRLSVVQIRGGAPVVVNQQREMVRLGEGEFGGGELQPEAMDRCVAVCRRFRDLVRSYGDGEIVAVAVPEVGKSRGPTILTEEVAARVAEVSREFFETVA